jgi:hypothetical protein
LYHVANATGGNRDQMWTVAELLQINLAKLVRSIRKKTTNPNLDGTFAPPTLAPLIFAAPTIVPPAFALVLRRN